MSAISGWTLSPSVPGLWAAFAKVNALGQDDESVCSYSWWFVRQETWYAYSLVDQLMQISRLTDGWDGYGAAGIDFKAVAHARNILPLLHASPDHILPGVAGTVLVEWERSLGRASLEIGQDTFSFYTSPTVGDPILLGGTIQGLDVGDINFALATITGNVVPQSLESRNWHVGVARRI